MRMIVLSALFAIGVGLSAIPAASAAPAANGIGNATPAASLLEDVQYRRCRSVRVCHRGPFGGRRCHYERVCRHW